MNEHDEVLAVAARIRSGSIAGGVATLAALERATACASLRAIRFLHAELVSRRAGTPRAHADSDLARRFRRAGLDPFGVTTAPDFGLLLASEPRAGPVARDPLDPTRTPAGSSGAAAAAVASVVDLLAPVRLALFEPLARAVIASGRSLSAVDLSAAERALVAVSHAMWRLFDSVDVIPTPMLTVPPPLLGSLPTEGDVEPQWRQRQAFAPYACLADVANVAALSTPYCPDDASLPLFVQAMGPMGSDGLLLQLAGRLEAARPSAFTAPSARLSA